MTKPAQAPANLPKPRLAFEDANGGGDEVLVSAGLPKHIELRIDGVTIWHLDGRDIAKRKLAEVLLRLRVVQLSDEQVQAMETA